MRTMHTTVLAFCLLFFVPACSGKIVRIGPNYQAEVEANSDFAASVVPLLEKAVQALREGGLEDECEASASLLIYARYWVPHLSQLQLAAAGIGEAPAEDPKPPTPQALCGQED